MRVSGSTRLRTRQRGRRSPQACPSSSSPYGARSCHQVGWTHHFRSLRLHYLGRPGRAWAWSELVLDVADVLKRTSAFPPWTWPLIAVDPDAERHELESARPVGGHRR